ncbi:unnamed protein product [marine sediment metagenome]|uniref:Uncharacterized protein n=1 Tax=marine sediment metagenome TaxID=412755 RepID=X1GC45_9ZZZZ
MTSKKELFDDLYKVIKLNSGAISANDVVATEIGDLQIPRGYCARIRKVRFALRDLSGQDSVDFGWHVLTALVLDADDETHVTIPTFEIDHDILVDHRFEMWGEVITEGMSALLTPTVVYDFDETLDCITVRNIRHNTLINGFDVTGVKPQVEITVWFTYEKISTDLYAKLLGIS